MVLNLPPEVWLLPMILYDICLKTLILLSVIFKGSAYLDPLMAAL